MLQALLRWFDSSHGEARSAELPGSWTDAGIYHGPAAAGSNWGRDVDWLRILPFIGLHVACLGVVWVGVSPVAVAVCAASYLLRMFAITGFYHRYFSHRTFKTGRVTQLVFAVLGASATQRGPLWWAAHHRRHHREADGPADPHRPADGFLWSHVGWFLCDRNFTTDRSRVRDWLRYPELRLLDRFDLLVPVAYAAGMYLLGAWLGGRYPSLGTSGAQMLVWGFFISTVLLTHATLLVNSLAHVWGHRRFDTGDDSRNNGVIALLTLGEGWHNNHHRYAGSARQGFYWWQIDACYWLLRLMAACSLVWDLRPVPARVLQEGRTR
jgi:stearoyl-CoA desaturase (Delta-9 desaturase)